ncbi:SPOR domain-containing protein [Methyloceanibacter sp.]|uniref:SPOR domain-containing protein n=1 Tax=Methyloceanibacter sp. TaxID=1965321 RepID=UPI003D6C8AA2
MAVHRKRPLLRDPNSGKRPRRRLILLSALIAVGGLGFLTQAQAQEGSLSGGAATFAAGKYDSTVRLMTGVLQGDKVAPADAAKALYFRGLAYQKLGQHTRAIADLGAAMWLGLSSSERTVALVNRSLAYQAAGLKTQADAELASARKSGSSGEVEKLIASKGGAGSDAGSISPFATEVRRESGRTSTVASASQDAPLPPAPAARNTQAANPSSWTTTQGEAPAAPPQSGNRLSRWWGSVRGPSGESAPEPALAPAPQSPPKATAAAVPSAWTTQTQAEAGAGPGTRVATASPAAPVPSGGGGNYLLQLSPTRSEAEASALWKTVVKQNQQLASLQPRVEKTDMGNLGTFYRLQIGPFPDKAESLKLCNALKRSGVDCFLVNP